MARRTFTETALYILALDTLWHIVLILRLYVLTTDTFNSAEGHWLIDGRRGIKKKKKFNFLKIYFFNLFLMNAFTLPTTPPAKSYIFKFLHSSPHSSFVRSMILTVLVKMMIRRPRVYGQRIQIGLVV